MLLIFRNLPVFGKKVGFYFEEFLQKQKSSLHVSPGSDSPGVSLSQFFFLS